MLETPGACVAGSLRLRGGAVFGGEQGREQGALGRQEGQLGFACEELLGLEHLERDHSLPFRASNQNECRRTRSNTPPGSLLTQKNLVVVKSPRPLSTASGAGGFQGVMLPSTFETREPKSRYPVPFLR